MSIWRTQLTLLKNLMAKLGRGYENDEDKTKKCTRKIIMGTI